MRWCKEAETEVGNRGDEAVVGAQGGRGEGSGVGSSGDRWLSTEEAFASWREGGAIATSAGTPT
jgi:hypothetical protein